MVNIPRLHENWTNGNRKDVVDALLTDGRPSKVLAFAKTLSNSDYRVLITMLQNRDK